MLKIVRKDPTQLNNDAPAPKKAALQTVRRRVYARAALAVMTVLMTVVIIFGMTAAWYTNVVQTGGLIFQVEELGVNVNAVIGESDFTAKPGDIGIIPLSAVNQGQDVVDITVSANKSALDPEMQKRLYFYVERQQSVNRETAQRTYLTDGSGYTYSVFAGEELTLTELYHNNAQLKWCWVYDVLGYYVLGSVAGNTVTVQEYLRPIEYDYDNATFAADGTLLTVDGRTTRDAFLQQLSETDGFISPIRAENAIDGYYPVEVDGNGYGVYVYLCSRDEVEANTDYDTALGHAALRGESANYEVKLTVNATPAERKTIAVTNANQLMQYLTDTSGQYNTIALANAGIELTRPIVIPEGRRVTLDLNGQTLTTTTARGIELAEGSALTVINGKMEGDGGYGFAVKGAELIVRNVEMRDYSMCVRLEDYASDGRDSFLRISDCDLFAATCALYTAGNGFDSEQKTTIIVENKSYLYSENQTIVGNGTATGDPRYGTNIQIINSTVESIQSATSAAISHPQMDSVLNIYKSAIIGYTGIAIKGGTLTIHESAVTGVGDEPEMPGNTVSGFTNTGAAISIETGYGYPIHVSVDTESVLGSYYADAVAVYQKSAHNLTLDIRAVHVNNRTKVEGTADSAQLAQLLLSGKDAKLSNNMTLSEAVTIPAGTHVMLDLNGKTLTTTAKPAFQVAEGGSLTVVNGSMAGTDKAFVVQGGGLTLDSVTMSGYGTGVRIADDVASGTDSAVRISNCKIHATGYGAHIMGNGSKSAEVTTLIIEDSELYGGVFALTGNGNATQAGTDIQIIHSVLRSDPDAPSAAIYHPQNDSTLTIRDSQLVGYTAMAVKGGTVTIQNTQITGTGADPVPPAHAVSGFADTAAAISIETSYEQPIRVTVDASSTLESYHANAVTIFEKDSPYLTLQIKASQKNRTKLQGTADSAEVVQQLVSGNDVKLSASMTLPEAVTIPENAHVVLDLNGKTLTTTAAVAITVAEGGSLSVVNGTMEGSGKAFRVQGGELTLDGVTMSGYGTGLRIEDDVATGTDSVIRISDCKIHATGYGAHIMGNGSKSAKATTLIIEDSELYGGVFALTGNGNATQAGTDIQIIRSVLESDPNTASAAIYHPQNDSTLTIRDSQLSGYTGIAIKGGAVTIENTKVTGTGADPLPPAHAVSGFTDTAAAISIETSYEQPITVTVDASSTLESYYAEAVVIFDENSEYWTINIQAKELDETKKTQ